MIMRFIPPTGVNGKRYPYTPQLLALDSCDNTVKGTPMVPSHLREIITLINLPFWQEELQSHKDEEFTKLILKGLSHGFRVGFNQKLLPQNLKPARRNMLSALEHPEVW